MSRHRILYVIGQLERGGAEQQLYYLLEHLKTRTTVVSLAPGGYWADPIRNLGHNVIELDRHRHFELERLKRIISIFRTLDPEIIHIFLDGISGLYARIGALLVNHRNVIVGERSHPSHYPKWFSIPVTLLNRKVKVIVCNSYTARQSLIQRHTMPPNRTLVIPNGIDTVAIQQASRVNQEWPWPPSWSDKLIVGMVGHLHPEKNPESFVQIADRISKIRPEARFVSVGDGPLRTQTYTLAQTLGLGDRILFTGIRHDVPFLLRHMDIFVLTSRREGMPNVILEAMAIGRPCVVSDVGDCSRLVQDGKNGYVIPPCNEQLFVERIVELLDNRQQRELMGARALEMIQDYSVQSMVEKYKRLYSEMLAADISEI